MSSDFVATTPPEDAVIWVMDSDICYMCGGLIGDFGYCLTCLYDGIDYDEEDEYIDDDWDGYYD